MVDLEREYWPLAPGLGSGDGEITVVAPFDRSPIARVETAGEEAVETALARSHGLFRDRAAWLPVTERIAILERLHALLEGQHEQLARESAREGGKPLVDSRVEVSRAMDCAQICIEELRTRPGEMVPMGATASSAQRVAFTRPEPIGVVVAVSAFNHPLNLIAHQVLPALAVGAPVIVKPAKATALSCLRLCALLEAAGLPQGWVTPLVPRDNTLAAKMVADSRVGFFSFIGSAKVGFALQRQLAPGVRSALEHGGVAPVVLCADADLDRAIPSLTKGGFYHAGQVCVSVQRIFVARELADDVAARMTEAAQALRVGDPVEDSTDVGPLIEPAECERVAAWVAEARDTGGKVLCGGDMISPTCYAPTVIFDPPDEIAVSRQEVFGPVVCIYPVADLDEALRRANQLDVSFQAAVWTQDIDSALALTTGLDAQTVMVNDHTAFRVDWMPFGGQKQSGYGLGGIPFSMHEMQVHKMVVIQSPAL